MSQQSTKISKSSKTSKTYSPIDIETKWYNFWESSHYFKPEIYQQIHAEHQNHQTFSIVIPPPNVTGSLHMGHAFQYTLMDILIRYNRMQGKETLWQMGTDAAGIATQMVVERQLNQENIKRTDLTREEFVDKVWQWKEHSGNRINKQIRCLGASVDWDSERFTMDEQMQSAVNKAFIELYEQGLIYKGNRLVNWDPILHTALSDLEVENIEKQGNLWYIQYPIENSDESLTIATTRPETLLGDTAVAVSPDDERYKNLIGQNILLPLTNRKIPIIADSYVDSEFGTGAVKITPAHDFNDFEMGKRHNLPIINILTIDAKLNTNVPEKYQGLTREQARKTVLADLEAQNLLVKTEAHTLKVPMGDRSNTVIEPYLVPQWYIKVEPLAKSAREVVNNKQIKFVPENYINMYNSWMNDLQDWCISRQLWWGNRIPAWYDEEGNIYVAETEPAVRTKYNLDSKIKLAQEQDTLDTWFAASLWPAASLGWPLGLVDNSTTTPYAPRFMRGVQKSQNISGSRGQAAGSRDFDVNCQQPLDNHSDRVNKFYPTSVLITGFDIIFFWVARMIMMGMHFNQDIPFKDVYFTGLIRDSHGQKMSKSKGNIIDPLDLIHGITLDELLAKRTSNMMQPHIAEKIKKQTQKEFPDGIPAFGTDALRFTLCALASHTRNINFDLKRIEGYRNFCNKLWNAARFIFMNLDNLDNSDNNQITSINNFNTILNNLSPADSWILGKLQETIKNSKELLDNYRFDLLAQNLYEFVWEQYCDWYLELSKVILNNPNTEPKSRANTRLVLLVVLENILKLLHPIIPFITEELWQQVASYLYADNRPSIMISSYPEFNNKLINANQESNINLIKNIIVAIRNIRSEMQISPSKMIEQVYIKTEKDDLNKLTNIFNQNSLLLDSIKVLAKINNIILDSNIETKLTATSITHHDNINIEIHIPMADLINKELEEERLNKEIAKLSKELDKITVKLNNNNFVARAPKELVEKEQQRQNEINTAINKLKEQLSNLANLQ